MTILTAAFTCINDHDDRETQAQSVLKRPSNRSAGAVFLRIRVRHFRRTGVLRGGGGGGDARFVRMDPPVVRFMPW